MPSSVGSLPWHSLSETAMGSTVNAQENGNSDYVAAIKTFAGVRILDCFRLCQQFGLQSKCFTKVQKNLPWEGFEPASFPDQADSGIETLALAESDRDGFISS